MGSVRAAGVQDDRETNLLINLVGLCGLVEGKAGVAKGQPNTRRRNDLWTYDT
jgi:hypothetical protein